MKGTGWTRAGTKCTTCKGLGRHPTTGNTCVCQGAPPNATDQTGRSMRAAGATELDKWRRRPGEIKVPIVDRNTKRWWATGLPKDAYQNVIQRFSSDYPRNGTPAPRIKYQGEGATAVVGPSATRLAWERKQLGEDDTLAVPMEFRDINGDQHKITMAMDRHGTMTPMSWDEEKTNKSVAEQAASSYQSVLVYSPKKTALKAHQQETTRRMVNRAAVPAMEGLDTGKLGAIHSQREVDSFTPETPIWGGSVQSITYDPKTETAAFHVDAGTDGEPRGPYMYYGVKADKMQSLRDADSYDAKVRTMQSNAGLPGKPKGIDYHRAGIPLTVGQLAAANFGNHNKWGGHSSEAGGRTNCGTCGEFMGAEGHMCSVSQQHNLYSGLGKTYTASQTAPTDPVIALIGKSERSTTSGMAATELYGNGADLRRHLAAAANGTRPLVSATQRPGMMFNPYGPGYVEPPVHDFMRKHGDPAVMRKLVPA